MQQEILEKSYKVTVSWFYDSWTSSMLKIYIWVSLRVLRSPGLVDDDIVDDGDDAPRPESLPSSEYVEVGSGLLARTETMQSSRCDWSISHTLSESLSIES